MGKYAGGETWSGYAQQDFGRGLLLLFSSFYGRGAKIVT